MDKIAVIKMDRVWDWIARTVFVSYVVLLTALLLMRDPIPDAGVTWWQWIEPFAHLISFTVLAGLAFICRLPVPGRIIVLGLVAYATATELLQGAIGWRTPDWIDWIQDVLGVAIGASAVIVGKRVWVPVGPEDLGPDGQRVAKDGDEEALKTDWV